ncbi:MAG: GNAT family N-acetyltransferase [Pseudomonadota bacterium]
MNRVVTLRELSFEHAPMMVEAAIESVAEVNPWMDWCTHDFNVETAKTFISQQIDARQTRAAYEFSLFTEDGRYLGGGGINSVNQQCRFANVGYWIRSSQTRSGYGTAALVSLVKWARANTELNRLEVVVAKNNHASRRVAEKSGALFEGVARSRLYNNGNYLDACVYAFTRIDL